MKSGTASTKSDTWATSGGMTRKPTPVIDEEREREHDARCITTRQTSTLEGLDGRVERRGEDDRDEDPGQDVPGEVDEDEEQADEDRDPEHREDGRRADQDDARLGGQHELRAWGRSGELPGHGSSCGAASFRPPRSRVLPRA